jgi:NADH dehydrogenase FAD-containing subunit
MVSYIYGVQSRNVFLTLLNRFRAATWNIEDKIFPVGWLNEIGELNVTDTFQIVDHADIFAIGDCSSVAETKQAITLPPKMKFIVHNILAIANAVAQGRLDMSSQMQLKHYKVADKATMYLPLGPNYGVSQLNGWVYGDKKTSAWKGKDLYCDLFWKELTGSKAPSIPQ